MGQVFSGFVAETSSAPKPSLEDIPESCLALVLARFDPPEICKLASLNRGFHGASLADFVWESKLPENYQFLVNKLMFNDSQGLAKKDIYARLTYTNWFDGGTKQVWMEKKSGGICVSVSWKGMKITGIDDRRYWNTISTHESRFQTIAYLQQIWWLEVEGELEFEFPTGNYSLFFRLQLGRPSKKLGASSSSRSPSPERVHGWAIKPVRFQFSTSTGEHGISECYLSEPWKWLHYHVGDFTVQDSHVPMKIKFSMTQIDCTHTKGGLSLDSVFICPIELNCPKMTC